MDKLTTIITKAALYTHPIFILLMVGVMCVAAFFKIKQALHGWKLKRILRRIGY